MDGPQILVHYHPGQISDLSKAANSTRSSDIKFSIRFWPDILSNPSAYAGVRDGTACIGGGGYG